MASRHRTTTHTLRKDDVLLWTSNNPEPGRTRPDMTSAQRHNTEQIAVGDGHHKHRSSSRRVETSDAVVPSTGVTSHSKSASRHRSTAQNTSSHQAVQPQGHATSSAIPMTATSSRHQAAYVDDPTRSFTRTRTERPSPRSSNERVGLPEDTRSARHGRSAYATMATVQVPTSTQTYWLDSARGAIEPSSSSRHHRDRDREKDREKERERERRREEKVRARLQDVESLRAKEKERDRERRREREWEQERVGRDRDGHRDVENTREREHHRRKEDHRAADRDVSQTQVPGATPQRPQYADDRPSIASGRHGAQTAQPIQSMSQASVGPNGHAMPSTAYYDPNIQAMSYRRPPESTPTASATVPQRSSERDKSSLRQHRPRRDRTAGQHSGQESGMSSSEQEHSIRERHRSADRRYVTRDIQMSGLSGSETERESMRERRKHYRTHVDMVGHAKPATELTEAQQLAASYKASRMQQQTGPSLDNSAHRPVGTAHLPASGLTHASALPSGQPPAHVGLTSQRHIPPVVSIRAGQGPADPQIAPSNPRLSSAMMTGRIHEQGHPDSTPFEAQTSSAPPTLPQMQVDGSRRGRQASSSSQHAMSSGVAQQPSHGEVSQANSYGNDTATGYMHPVQQAIRSVEGIVRPPSTRPSLKVPLSNTALSQTVLADQTMRMSTSKENERPYTSKSSSSAVQAPGYQLQSTPHYSSSDVRLPGSYPASPRMQQHPIPPSNDTAPAPPGIFGVAHSHSSQVDEKTPRARPMEVSVQYQSSTYPSLPNVQAPDSTKTSTVLPSTHSITVAQATFMPSRSQTTVPDVKSPWLTTSVDHGAKMISPSPTRHADARLAQDSIANQHIPGGHSPSHYAQTNIGRSPGPSNGPTLEATPRSSAAPHLPSHRNGSTDTITQSGIAKSSPNIQANQSPLNHRSSVGSLQPHASSRPDMTPSARPNVLSGYPDIPRYRSPAPIPIPYRPPSAAPNPTTTYSQSYGPQTTSRPTLPASPTAPHQDPYTNQRSTTAMSSQYAQPQASRGHQTQATDHGARTQDPAYGLSTTTPLGQRPPRSAPPLAPSINTRQQHDIASPIYQPSGLPPSSAPPRSNTFPMQQPRRPDPTPAPPTSHTRAASEPHYPASRPPLTVQTNTAHTKSRSGSHGAPAPSDQELLLTPSSIAPSMLPRQLSSASSMHPPTSRSTRDKPVKEKEKESGKKGGFFSGISLFRSRSNPPKPLQELPADPARDTHHRRRQGSAPAAPNPQSTSQGVTRAPEPATTSNRGYATMPANAAPPTSAAGFLTVPGAGVGIPTSGMSNTPTSGGRLPPSSMYSPFRLFSKRHRTVSAASVEAVDGTVANTVITGADSNRSSTAGRLSPPLRDPLVAAQEWRNKEEAELLNHGTGTWRIRRPGVTFDIGDDVPETVTTRPPRKMPRRQPPAVEEVTAQSQG